MAHTNGKFIVIEGSDGSGKTVQTKRLVARLGDRGFPVNEFDFPRHRQPSAWFVDQYLDGNFGPLKGPGSINPRTASLFYALDRFAAAPDIRAALEAGHIAISNRYVGSNLGHQGGKFRNAFERHDYLRWDYYLEYEMNRIPKPDLNIILLVPPETSQGLVDRKESAGREYISNGGRDLHEKDLEHLANAYATYRELPELFPDDFTAIDCMDGNGQLLPIDAIHEKVWVIAAKLLGIPEQTEVLGTVL